MKKIKLIAVRINLRYVTNDVNNDSTNNIRGRINNVR